MVGLAHTAALLTAGTNTVMAGTAAACSPCTGPPAAHPPPPAPHPIPPALPTSYAVHCQEASGQWCTQYVGQQDAHGHVRVGLDDPGGEGRGIKANTQNRVVLVQLHESLYLLLSECDPGKMCDQQQHLQHHAHCRAGAAPAATAAAAAALFSASRSRPWWQPALLPHLSCGKNCERWNHMAGAAPAAKQQEHVWQLLVHRQRQG